MGTTDQGAEPSGVDEVRTRAWRTDVATVLAALELARECAADRALPAAELLPLLDAALNAARRLASAEREL